MKLSLVEIANAIATLVLVVILAWVKYREKRLTKAAGLSNNPERCEQHSIKIAVIEGRLERIEKDIEEIKGKLS
jgi:uncharacterized protein YaeQ